MRNTLILAAGLLFVGATAYAQDAATCMSDEDCAADEYCELLDCGPDTDCGEGGVCMPDEAGAPRAECADDSECPEGSICVEECWEDSDGGGGCTSYCMVQEPIEPISECESDADCGEGESCLVACYDCDPDDESCEGGCFGECIGDDPYYGECMTDDDCGAGQSCVAMGTSTCPGMPDCEGADCPDPEPCVDETYYYCMDDPEPECETDADCGPGFACEAIGGAVSMPACPDDGSDCEDMPYVEETFYGCVPAQCESDADCGEGLECMEFGWTACPDIACAPGEDCPDVECEEVVEAYCAPAYIGPCDVDADCGEGFTCEAEEICSCTGWGGTETPVPDDGGDYDGEAEDPMEYPVDEECTCEPSGTNYCAPIEQECMADSECPEGWSCEFYATPDPVEPIDPEETDGTDEQPPTPAPDVMMGGMCVPPYGDYWTPGRNGGGYDDAVAEAVGEESDDDLQVSVNPDPEEATRPLADDGCQVAPTRAPFGALIGGLFGLIALRRRRRS